MSAKLGNPDAPELFDSLVPVAVHQALAQYDVRKSELVNKEVDKLKEATNLANQLLSSMNLPAALEDTKGKLKYSTTKSENVPNRGCIPLPNHAYPSFIDTNIRLFIFRQ